MTTKKIKWRLSKLPDTHEVSLLVEKGILTKDEAREILFSLETEQERDKKSLEDEIKFLRELVSKLSNNSRTEIIKQIEFVEKPYHKQNWYEPYKIYCQADLNNQLISMNGAVYATNNALNTTLTNYSVTPDFTAIQTF